MKKHLKPLALMLSFPLLILFLSVGLANAADKKMPADLQAIATKAAKLAGSYAKQLDGAWGDQHVAQINSKEGYAFAGYEKMRAVLSGLAAKKEATYVYVLSPSGPADSAPFFLSADASEKPDDYGTEYKWEAGFAAAWKGTATAADYVEKDDDGSLLLSGYAPVRDSKGNVVALLGVDCPAPIAEKYPDFIQAK